MKLPIINITALLDMTIQFPMKDDEFCDRIISLLELCGGFQYEDSANSRRNLADFMCYLKFDEILNNCWNMELKESERMFFYPLYLWWKVTGVIPTRPREFILTIVFGRFRWKCSDCNMIW